MKEKIEELKQIMETIDTMIWLLEGNSSKSTFTGDGTVEGELDCYGSEGNNLRLVIESIINEHGAEMLPTASNDSFNLEKGLVPLQELEEQHQRKVIEKFGHPYEPRHKDI